MVDGRTAETCNVYNMIKMARTLFSVEPDIRYADFHERALFNHILASQDPDDGRVCYMVPVGRGVQHEYQGKFQDFTCCVGSAMESHALHADGHLLRIRRQALGEPVRAFHGGLEIGRREARNGHRPAHRRFGDAQGHSAVRPKSSRWRCAVRSGRAKDSASKSTATRVKNRPGRRFVRRNRTDVESGRHGRTRRSPKTLRKEPLADNPNRIAVMWGPLVLAGDLGPERNWEENEKRAEQGMSRNNPPPSSCPKINP